MAYRDYLAGRLGQGRRKGGRGNFHTCHTKQTSAHTVVSQTILAFSSTPVIVAAVVVVVLYLFFSQWPLLHPSSMVSVLPTFPTRLVLSGVLDRHPLTARHRLATQDCRQAWCTLHNHGCW